MGTNSTGSCLEMGIYANAHQMRVRRRQNMNIDEDSHHDSNPSKKKQQKVKMSKMRQLSQGSVDIYAAQCKECLKWRVIDTQQEFEEIRQKVNEEPFYCNRKPNTSCDDPADIEYDATRTWVIDKPNLPKSPEGFRRSLVLRKDYSKLDPYYITPTGKKLRTRNEIASFLKEHPEIKDVSVSDFDFSTPKIMQDTIPEIVGKKDSANKKIKMSKDDN